MATPRKYPTLTEFKALENAVHRIEQQLQQSKQIRPSINVDAQMVAEKLGLVDADDVPVAVGDYISRIDRNEPRRVREITIKVCAEEGKVSVVVDVIGGPSAVAVDMRLPNHVVTKKATA